MTKFLGAVDIGNANTKVKLWSEQTGDRLIVHPSQLTPIPDTDGYPGAFSLRRKHSKPICWMVETVDGQELPLDSEDGKPRLGLRLLLSTLYDLIPQETDLELIASTHNVGIFGDAMKTELEGEHLFKRVGDVEKLVRITVKQVVHEGAGAIIAASPKTANNFVLDIGGGTVIGTAYQKLVVKPGCIPYPIADWGTRHLIAEFAKCDAVNKAIGTGRLLTFEQARAVIDDPSHTLQIVKSKKNLSKAVSTEVERWLAVILSKLRRSAATHINASNGFIATGGALQIPSVAAYLQKEGYAIAPSPLTANVDGLLEWMKRGA
jgi:hypothetical protein